MQLLVVTLWAAIEMPVSGWKTEIYTHSDILKLSYLKRDALKNGGHSAATMSLHKNLYNGKDELHEYVLHKDATKPALETPF